MSYIRYKNNNLFVENVSVRRLASKFSTPFYLYSESNIIENYKSFSNNFKKTKPLICFSVKANSNIQILKILKKMGSGADVVSGGELLKVIKSGIKPKKIVFSGDTAPSEFAPSPIQFLQLPGQPIWPDPVGGGGSNLNQRANPRRS